jgi:hypothetical protein
MTRPTALLVGPIAGPSSAAIRHNCCRVAVELGHIADLLGYRPVCIHAWALNVIELAGGIETPEDRAEGIRRSLALVDEVAAQPGSVLLSIMRDDGLGWSRGTTLDVQRWRQHHGPHRQIHRTWAEWEQVPAELRRTR